MKVRSFVTTFISACLKNLLVLYRPTTVLIIYSRMVFYYISVPPHQLIIYDKVGRSVSDVIGPLEESSELVLTCEVRGGKFWPHLDQFISKFAVSVLLRLPNQMIEQTYPA